MTVQRPPSSQSPLVPTDAMNILTLNKRKSTLFKEVELFYEVNPDQDSELDPTKLLEIDYQEGNKLDLPIDCRAVRLSSKFYQESTNTINFVINYAFTQNSDKEDQKQVMRQYFRKSLKIKS